MSENLIGLLALLVYLLVIAAFAMYLISKG